MCLVCYNLSRSFNHYIGILEDRKDKERYDGKKHQLVEETKVGHTCDLMVLPSHHNSWAYQAKKSGKNVPEIKKSFTGLISSLFSSWHAYEFT